MDTTLKSRLGASERSLGTLHLQGISPALDVGGAWGFNGSGYDPGTLAHKTWSQIAGSLANPHDRIAQRADGLANLFTAAICSATKGRPGNVCKSRGVQAAAAAVLGKYPSQPTATTVVMKTPRSARRSAVAVAVVAVVAVLFGSAAAAGAATAPRDALRQALRQVRSLAPQASAGAPASAAAALAQATAPGLWITAREADAPPYGRNVFTASATAVRSLGDCRPPAERQRSG